MNVQNVLRLCYNEATASDDPSTQNCAVLAMHDKYNPRAWSEEWTPFYDTLAINDLPSGVHDTPARWERPLKYQVVEHAERNAIYRAANCGIRTDSLTMVCPWAACADCARAIIQAGIIRLITHKQAHDRSPTHWRASIAIALTMLEEAGVEVEFFDGPVGGGPVLHSGEKWNP